VEVPVAAASSIGQTLVKFRKDQSLTLQQLAKKVSLSAAYLSQIEHDKASPSISTLRSLAKALGVRLVDFFEDELINDPVVMTPDKWSRVLIPGWQSDTRRIVHHIGTKRMEPFFTTIPPGGKSKKGYAHPGEEFGFVLEGVLTITIGDENHEVGPMNSFYFSSAIPHSWINKGKIPVRLIWVVSPPSW
jgi:transcriptional regulator with XRE-family HTH domain